MPALIVAVFLIALRLLALGYMFVVILDVFATTARVQRHLLKDWVPLIPTLGPHARALLAGQDIAELEQIAAEWASYSAGLPSIPTTSWVVQVWRDIRPSTYILPSQPPIDPLAHPRAEEALALTQIFLAKRGVDVSTEELRAQLKGGLKDAARTTR